MLHTKPFNICQKPYGNNKINFIHFYPGLWTPVGDQDLHLTKSVHHYRQVGPIMDNRKVSYKKASINRH